MTKRHKADFHTTVEGIPCGVRVLWYSQAVPMRTTGTGMGDADPPEPEEFEFDLLDRGGYPATWLAEKLSDQDVERIQAEYEDLFNEFR